jgi:crossover junction endodeoxyribonuclease RusA
MKLTVIGVPVPQGNKSGFPIRRKDGSIGVAMREGRSKEAKMRFSDWRASIAACARLWLEQNGMPAPLDGAVELTIKFYMPRPKSLRKSIGYPLSRPDLSKLVRCVEDALTGIAYVDDSRIVAAHLFKGFAVDSPPRAEIFIRDAAGVNQGELL